MRYYDSCVLTDPTSPLYLHAETRFRLSAKRTSPFKSVGASVQSTTGSRGVRISCSNAGYTMPRGSVKGTDYTHSIRQFPLHFPSRASPCAITFQLESTVMASTRGNRLVMCPWASVRSPLIFNEQSEE